MGQEPVQGWDVDLSSELELARELATLGGDVALAYFRRDPATKKKPDGTWATEADLAAEARIRARIAEVHPDHNVLGEEEGLCAADGGDAVDVAPTWIIDPIDGTNNFMAGIPVWATLIGFRIGGTTCAGVCHAPALHETYDAGTGMGARFNGEPIHVDAVNSLEDALVCVPGGESFLESGLGAFYEALLTRCYRSRGFADFWGHMLVARGAAHVMVEPELNIWDVAALEPIVSEAGGRMSHLDGRPWQDKGSCLTTNGALHGDVVALFEGAPGTPGLGRSGR
ncbi:histidinol-phosphatase [soil metagenome]